MGAGEVSVGTITLVQASEDRAQSVGCRGHSQQVCSGLYVAHTRQEDERLHWLFPEQLGGGAILLWREQD